MKLLIKIFIIILVSNTAFSQWEIRTNYDFVRHYTSDGSKMYIGRNNGMTVYDFDTKISEHLNSLNSELPGNYINSFMTLPDNTILVSTNGGLAIIENGVITKNKPICTSYPDNDARDLYKDSSGNIWTFSSHKVHKYSNGVWKTFDLSDSIKYAFDLAKMYIFKDKVWAIFEDNTISNTLYYFSSMTNDNLKIAVISDSGIVKTFQTKDDFPFRQGPVSLACGNKDVYLKNMDNVYIFNDTTWTKTDIFKLSSSTIPYYLQDLIADKKGNIWCTVYNENFERAYPICYDEKANKLTKYLFNVEEDKKITSMSMLEDGRMIAYTNKYFYFQNDTGWFKVTAKDCNLPDSIYVYVPKIVNGKKYVIIIADYNAKNDGTLFCIDDGTKIIPERNNFPFTTITYFSVKKDGKGIFKGRYWNENFQYEADSAFSKAKNVIINDWKIVTCTNGYVYWYSSISSDSTTTGSSLTTWEGNNINNIDMGYNDKLSPLILDFDSYNEYLIALIHYFYNPISGTQNISIYNTTDGSLQKFDNIDSIIPGPIKVISDKYQHFWVFSKTKMIELYSGNVKEFNLPIDTSDYSIYFDKISYDARKNELLCSCTKSDNFYFFDIATEKWDSIKISESGIINNYIIHKKLINNNIYASDDKGYLYRYVGKGKFQIFNLRIAGRGYLGFPINDFSLDANYYLHLGTDIGLLTNKSILVGVEDNQVSEVTKISVYPNPATDYIRIYSPEELNNSKIEIFTILGNKIFESEYKDRIDVSGLSAGVYFVKINNINYKFVKI